jgi:CMP-N,N'-diacetyllegionaminic acid synthase
MYMGKTFLAIIPARSGSKGIYKKNIIEVNGKPLIDYTIEEAKKSIYLDKIIISTDSEEIAKIAENCGAEVPFLRPEELARDESKTIDVLVHLVDNLKIKGISYDYLVLLQPTQPLRKSWHIDESIVKIIEENAENLLSISSVREHPILFRTVDKNDRVHSLLNMNSTVRRQDFPEFFKVNGAIYINKLNEMFNKNVSLNDNTLCYIMDKKYDIDIDDPIDLEIFKILLKIY